MSKGVKKIPGIFLEGAYEEVRALSHVWGEWVC